MPIQVKAIIIDFVRIVNDLSLSQSESIGPITGRFLNQFSSRGLQRSNAQRAIKKKTVPGKPGVTRPK